MRELTSVVPVGTVDFIKFLTPQGTKSAYICKCFKLFNPSKRSMLSVELYQPRPDDTELHHSNHIYHFSTNLPYFIFASYNTCHFRRFIKPQLKGTS